MKPLLLVLLAAVAAFSQVPDKSTVGSTTIYVKDTVIPVPYGPDETRAVIAACQPSEVSYAFFEIGIAGISLETTATVSKISKTDSGYCAVFLAPAAKADLTLVGVSLVAASQVTAGSTAASPGSPQDRLRRAK